jgi:hypothetical protein
MRIVRIGKDKVSYPKSCACCMGRPQGILEVRKEDLTRLAVAAVLAADAGGAAASLRRRGATKVPYCGECRDHIRWGRMGGWFGLVLSVAVDGLFGFLAGAAIWGVADLFAFDWYLRHPQAVPPLLMGAGTLVGVAIALSNLRWKPQSRLGRRHARLKDAVEIVSLGAMDLKFHNDEFAEGVIRANPGAQYSHG